MSSSFYARNISSQLSISFSDAEARRDELNGMIKTANISIYTDDWFYSGVESSNPTSYERIQSADKKYKKSGYEGVPYHYVVTNKTSKTLSDSGIYSVYGTTYASPLDNSDICIALLCRPGTSLDKDDYSGVDTLIENLITLIKYIINTHKISVSNINLSTSAQNTRGKKSINGADEFMLELLKDITDDEDKDYDTIVDRDDIDFIVVAGPSSGKKRTLGVLSEIICGEVNDDFIDFMKELNPDCIDSDATEDTVLKIGSFLYIPNDTDFIEGIRTESDEDNINNQAEINRQNLLYLNEYIDRYKSVSFADANTIHRMDEDFKQKISTSRGGKTEQSWHYQGYEFPGYHNAFLQFDKIGSNEEPIYLQFLISPSDFSESRSNIINDIKTMGGWLAQRCGRSAINIQFSGYMLDIKAQMERHEFLENYKNYIEDTKVEDQTYVNYYKQKFVIEGRDYYGHVTSIQFSKSAQSPFLYRYTIMFTAYSDKKIYDAEWALLDRSLINQGVVSNKYLSGTVDEVTNVSNKSQYVTEDTLSNYIDKDSEAYDYLLNQIRNAAGDEKILAKITNSLNTYSSDHWAKKYLDTLISSNVITNIEDWGKYDNKAVLSHCVALACKALLGKSVIASPSDHWSVAYMEKLYKESCVTQETYQIWLTKASNSENEAMLQKWLVEVLFLVVLHSSSSASSTCKNAIDRYTKGTSPLPNGYYANKQKYSNQYEAYLDGLCVSGYINSPQEWDDFSNNGTTTNGSALALISKVGGYHVKD